MPGIERIHGFSETPIGVYDLYRGVPLRDEELGLEELLRKVAGAATLAIREFLTDE